MNNSKGSSLLSVSLYTLTSGVILISIVVLLSQYNQAKGSAHDQVAIDTAYGALQDFFSENGRYPCPARLDSAPNDPEFGREVASCTISTQGIQTITDGTGNVIAAVGTYPTRSLNLPDNVMFDSKNKRMKYVISTSFSSNLPGVQQEASIIIEDRNGNSVTSENVIFMLFQHKNENQNAFSYEGLEIASCDDNTFFGENCDGDTTFAHTALTSNVENNAKYALNVRYKSETPCRLTATINNPTPRRAGLLLDTSGSMADTGNCPPYSAPGETCSRMQSALWAVHHALDARLNQVNDDENYFTGFSGFSRENNTDRHIVLNEMNANFAIEEQSDINNIYEHQCPVAGWGTPLGEHIRAMSQLIDDGTEDVPNVITVITDGLNSRGIEPLAVANNIRATMPNLQINVIDVGNNPTLVQIANLTGGTYSNVSNPQEVRDLAVTSVGGCFDSNYEPEVREIEPCLCPDGSPYDATGNCPVTVTFCPAGTTRAGRPVPPSGDCNFCPNGDAVPVSGVCPVPIEDRPRVTANLDLRIEITDPQYLYAFSGPITDPDQLAAAIASLTQEMNFLIENAEREAGQELNVAISDALSDALALNRGIVIESNNATDIKNALNAELDIAVERSLRDLDIRLSSMPPDLAPLYRTGVGVALEEALRQFESAMDPFIDQVIDSGEVTGMEIITQPITFSEIGNIETFVYEQVNGEFVLVQ